MNRVPRTAAGPPATGLRAAAVSPFCAAPQASGPDETGRRHSAAAWSGIGASLLRGCSSIGLAFPSYQHQQRVPEDLQIKRQRPVAQVLDVAGHARLHLFQLGGLATAATDLCQAGDAGWHLVADHVALDEPAVL